MLPYSPPTSTQTAPWIRTTDCDCLVIRQTTTDEYFEGFDEADLFLSGRNLRDLLESLPQTA